jgi:hypothetical protein
MYNSNSTVHDDSVWKRRVVGKLVFKFQKLPGVFGAPIYIMSADVMATPCYLNGGHV